MTIIKLIENAGNIGVSNRVVRTVRVYNGNVPNGITDESFTQKGGVLVGTGSGTYTEVAPGSNGQVLIFDNNEVSGMRAGTLDDTTEWISVKVLGATGDGTTDDTTAIQNTIDGATAGDVVYFPPGTYLITDITLKPGVKIMGAGPSQSILKAKSNSTKMLKYTAAATQVTFYISGLYFDVNSKTSCYGIYLDGTDSAKRLVYIRISECHLVGAFTRAINLKYCANVFINNLFITLAPIGIYIDICADVDIVSCKVQNGSSTGFYINGGAGAYDEGVRLTSCSTNGQANGITINGQDWGIAQGCSFTTCSGGAAILTSAKNWKFTGCEFSVAGTPALHGLSIDSGCQSIEVVGCHFSINVYGVVLAGTRCIIQGNQFEADTNFDIYLSGSTSKCVINGNICNSTGSAYSIVEAASADYNIVSSNLVNGLLSIVGAHSASANNVNY